MFKGGVAEQREGQGPAELHPWMNTQRKQIEHGQPRRGDAHKLEKIYSKTHVDAVAHKRYQHTERTGEPVQRRFPGVEVGQPHPAPEVLRMEAGDERVFPIAVDHEPEHHADQHGHNNQAKTDTHGGPVTRVGEPAEGQGAFEDSNHGSASGHRPSS